MQEGASEHAYMLGEQANPCTKSVTDLSFYFGYSRVLVMFVLGRKKSCNLSANEFDDAISSWTDCQYAIMYNVVPDLTASRSKQKQVSLPINCFAADATYQPILLIADDIQLALALAGHQQGMVPNPT